MRPTEKINNKQRLHTMQNSELNQSVQNGQNDPENIQKKYQILELIGFGTFGKVYKIKNKYDKLFAIKTVLQEKKYKNRELSIITQVKHFNIVILYEHYYKNKDSQTFLNLIMEYMPQTLSVKLRDLRKMKRTIDPHLIKIYSFQMFKALAYFEDINLCHRDLKPQNILINPHTHQLKICDFGSAKILTRGEDNVTYICSRFYRAPELLFGFKDYWTEIDVWSAGCILVELYTYQVLFPGESSVEQVIQIIKILGTPSEEYLQSKNLTEQEYTKLPVIKPHNWRKIFKKYKVDEKFIDLIESVLVFDRAKRIKPADALLHPYFQDLNSEEYKPWTQKNPNLFNFQQNQFVGYAKQRQKLIERFSKKQDSIHYNNNNHKQQNIKRSQNNTQKLSKQQLTQDKPQQTQQQSHQS